MTFNPKCNQSNGVQPSKTPTSAERKAEAMQRHADYRKAMRVVEDAEAARRAHHAELDGLKPRTFWQSIGTE